MTTNVLALPAHGEPRWEVWLRRHRLWFEVAGGVVLLLAIVSVMWQLAYPADRALPFMQIGSLQVGGEDRATIIKQLDDFAQQGTLTISSPSKQWQTKWQSIGITVDADASADAALAYATWERFVPFSSLLHAARSQQLPLVAIADEDRLSAFAAQIVKDDQLAAHDANIKVVDGKTVVDQAKNGYKFSANEVKSQVQATTVGANTTLHLVPDTLPARPADQLAHAKAQADAVLAHHPIFKVAGKSFVPTTAEIGGWLSFTDDPKSGQLQMNFNRDALLGYLAHLDNDAGIEPGTSTITLLDNQEITRTPAASGQTVATDANVAAIKTVLQGSSNQPTATLAAVATGPRVSYVRTYSQTDSGLQAIINQWRADTPGTYSIIVRELGGQNRYGEIAPDQPYVTASTFKLFVYYAVQQRIQAGTLQYGDMTDMGWTVDACLQEMIVHSTNPCAISLLNLVGWQTADDEARAAGFTSTFINNEDGTTDKHSTVRDETNYMLRLYYGTLYGKEGTDRLLGYLKRQIWRGGVPSGVPGTTVADKVGFYDGWVHDIAIVYGPKSTYILGVMSHGGSDAVFADLSRRVASFFQN